MQGTPFPECADGRKIMLKKDFLESMRDGQELSLWQLAVLTMQLSIPAIMAQLSSIVMQIGRASCRERVLRLV